MSTHLNPSQIRAEFWACLMDRLNAAGHGGYHRANYCYVPLGAAGVNLVLTAPTGDGGAECKLPLAAAGRATRLTAEEILEQLLSDREAIEAEVGCGPLEWGSARSATRIYLRRDANIADRSTWNETIAWLLTLAGRFKDVFRPRLLATRARRSVGRVPAQTPARGRTEPCRSSDRSSARSADSTRPAKDCRPRERRPP